MQRKEFYKDGKLIEVFDNRFLAEEKVLKIDEVKVHAKSLLSKTDWHIVRASELGIPVESNVLDTREAVRNASNQAEDMVNACNELINLDQCLWMDCFG